MNTHGKFMGLIVAILLSMAPVAVLAAETASTDCPSPPPLQMAVSGLASDDTYLYVIAHGKIMQYQIAGMTLAQSASLPELTPPSGAPGPPPEAGSGAMPPHPPFMALPHGACVSNGYLYVLAGHMVYQYSTADLSLKSTTELPAPELPSSD